MLVNIHFGQLSENIRNNLRSYIVAAFDKDGYDEYAGVDKNNFKQVANAIYDCFMNEKFYNYNNEYNTFRDWCQGLPSILDCCYYYNRPASKDIGLILGISQEKIEEIFTEVQCGELLTDFIHNEIVENL